MYENSINNNNSNNNTSQDKFDRFESWLRENGARFDMLELRAYDCPAPQADDITSGREDEDTVDEEKKDPGSNNSNNNLIHHHRNSASASSSTRCMMTNNNNNNNNETSLTDEESEMRGVHAIRHIPPNTVCMSIPRRCLITVEMGQATPIGQAILSSDLDLDAPKHIFLMIYILWDRKVNGPNSFFYPYYEILPRTLRNMPIFWNGTELAELEGSYILHQIADRNAAITEDYNSICTIAPQLRTICTIEEFKWARMCVCSRNFGLQIDGHRTSAMVPHADMLNHYRPRETKWTFDEEKQSFTITSLQHIPAGAEVLDSYGQKCNHRFLLNYGFAVEDNREMDGFCPNEVPLELMINPKDICYKEKMDFWLRGEQQHNHNSSSAVANIAAAMSSSSNSNSYPKDLLSINTMKRVRVCVSNNENTRLLFSLLRTLACNTDEIRAISQPNNNSTNSFNTANNYSSNNHNGNNNSNTDSNRSSSLFGLPDVMIRHYSPSISSSSSNNSNNNNNNSSSSSKNNNVNEPVVVLTGSPAPVGATYHRSCRDVRHPISLRNEQDAMKLLLDICQRQLARYPTTLAQDIISLSTNNIDEYPKFSNRRHAKIQVRGEKEVLHHFITWAETALKVLNVIENELHDHQQTGGTSLSNNNNNDTSTSAIEVRWRGSPKIVTTTTSNSNNNNSNYNSYDATIRRMEEDTDENGIIHHTIVRYCADVLGSLRREEFKNLRRKKQQQRSSSYRRSGSSSNGSRNNNNNNNSNANNSSGYL